MQLVTDLDRNRMFLFATMPSLALRRNDRNRNIWHRSLHIRAPCHPQCSTLSHTPNFAPNWIAVNSTPQNSIDRSWTQWNWTIPNWTLLSWTDRNLIIRSWTILNSIPQSSILRNWTLLNSILPNLTTRNWILPSWIIRNLTVRSLTEPNSIARSSIRLSWTGLNLIIRSSTLRNSTARSWIRLNSTTQSWTIPNSIPQSLILLNLTVRSSIVRNWIQPNRNMATSWIGRSCWRCNRRICRRADNHVPDPSVTTMQSTINPNHNRSHPDNILCRISPSYAFRHKHRHCNIAHNRMHIGGRHYL